MRSKGCRSAVSAWCRAAAGAPGPSEQRSCSSCHRRRVATTCCVGVCESRRKTVRSASWRSAILRMAPSSICGSRSPSMRNIQGRCCTVVPGLICSKKQIRSCAYDRGSPCRRGARSTTAAAPPRLRSIHAAWSATVVRSKKTESGMSTPSSALSWAAIWAARSDWPPARKKSSSTPTVTPRSRCQRSATIFSVSVRGPANGRSAAVRSRRASRASPALRASVARSTRPSGRKGRASSVTTGTGSASSRIRSRSASRQSAGSTRPATKAVRATAAPGVGAEPGSPGRSPDDDPGSPSGRTTAAPSTPGRPASAAVSSPTSRRPSSGSPSSTMGSARPSGSLRARSPVAQRPSRGCVTKISPIVPGGEGSPSRPSTCRRAPSNGWSPEREGSATRPEARARGAKALS